MGEEMSDIHCPEGFTRDGGYDHSGSGSATRRPVPARDSSIFVGYWVVVTRHPQLGNSDGVAPHKSVACETVFCLVLIERS